MALKRRVSQHLMDVVGLIIYYAGVYGEGVAR